MSVLLESTTVIWTMAIVITLKEALTAPVTLGSVEMVSPVSVGLFIGCHAYGVANRIAVW